MPPHASLPYQVRGSIIMSSWRIDDAEGRFEGLFGFLAAGLARRALRFGLLRQAPGPGDPRLGFRLGRRAEVIGPVGGDFAVRRAYGRAGARAPIAGLFDPRHPGIVYL